MKSLVQKLSTLCICTSIALPLLYATHLQPIRSINEEAYLGVWFQMYASASVKYTFELGGNCVTARYRRTSRGNTIEVQNTVRPFTNLNDGSIPFGDLFFNIVIDGFAVQSPDVDGQFEVTLPTVPGLPFGICSVDIDSANYTDPGNYWIIELGPIVEGKYDYAIVTNNEDGDQLYVLARDIETFPVLYEEGILERLEEYGFTGPFNRPRKTNQKGCNYEEYKFRDDFP